MRFSQPYDGRTSIPAIHSPAPLGYRIRKTPRSKKLWTFCEDYQNAVVALNTLRAQGYTKALIEALEV